jgi:tRNA(fMet)-specific endonuclease VapC
MVSLIYLLDTNVVSEPLRPAPNQKILDRLQQHQSEIAIASVIWHELLFGCYRLPPSVKRTAIETYLRQVIAPTIPILPYDTQAAEWHAAERTRLTSIGRTPSFADGQIAAIARINQLIVITINRTDYTDYQGVRVEDWRV